MSYDPATAQKAAVMARLQALEDKLFAYASSSTPLPSSIQDLIREEIKVLAAIVQVPKESCRLPTATLPIDSTRLSSTWGNAESAPQFPTIQQMAAAAGGGPFLNPVTTPGLTDAQRAVRGSAAAFDESTVGGYNYKDRAIEMCRQLKEEYGDNSTFGCISDPNSVSSTYSWEGNYRMICNRLGDVWGSQGGLKYGCPEFNPSAKFSQF
jgi:hypothetical protein